MELAFYAPCPPHPESGRRTASRPVPLDIDGDGVYDALVTPAYGKRRDFIKERDEGRKALLEMARRNKDRRAWDSLQKEEEEGVSRTNYDERWDEDGSWGLRVLNLRPLHRRTHGIEHPDENAIAVGPFVPRTMFLIPLLPDGESVDRDHTTINVYPVKIQTMHIPIQHTRLGDEERLRQRHKKETNTMTTTTTTTYGKNSEIPPKNDPLSADYDWTRHYFCGKDWHHASQVCHRHCGGGQSSECGEGETCYADTPCDVNMEEGGSTEEETSSMALTKSGTLPGVVTVWSDGGITLHVVTADVPPLNITHHVGDTNHRTKRTKQSQIKRPELELRQLWRVHPLEYSVIEENSVVEFSELGIAFESGVVHNKSDKLHKNGVIILGCRYALNDKGRLQTSRVGFHALDAMTGTSLWDMKGDQYSSSKLNKGDAPLVPIIHTTSSARRRSHLPTTDVLDSELDNENAFVEGNDVMTSTECLSHFRSSVFDRESGALPHDFWGDDGELGSISVGRFDQTKLSGGKRMKRIDKKGLHFLANKNSGGFGERHGKGPIVPRDPVGQVKGNTNTISRGSSIDQNSNWRMSLIQRAIPRRLIKQHRYSASHPHSGRPNVILFHGREGLAVLSLKNGRPVCHVSLMDGSLYADIDEDGKIDTIQVVTSSKSQVDSSAVASLIQRFEEEADESGSASIMPDAPVICHALVTSGLPPREELFTAPLCLGGPINRPQVTAAPPLLVEGSMGYGNDVVFAMNNGVVVRYDFNGREIWRKKGGIADGTPSWHSGQSAFLGRLQFGVVRETHSSVSASSHRNQHRPGSPLRPILLSADDGAVLISPTSGNVLASVVFPQLVKSQPTLADLSGDGTDDLIVVSDDAIWGYRIVVDTEQSGYFVIIVVTLLIGVAVAALIHKMNLQPSLSPRRSTDL